MEATAEAAAATPATTAAPPAVTDAAAAGPATGIAGTAGPAPGLLPDTASPAPTTLGTAAGAEPAAVLSKRARKRLENLQKLAATRDAFLEQRRAKKKERRERQRARRREQYEADAANGVDGSAARRAAEAARREMHAKELATAPTAVIDLAFESLMTDNEITSVCRQVAYCYSVNRRTARPLRMVAAGITGRIQARFDGPDNASGWKEVRMEQQPYQRLFPADKIVYLSADSPNVLHTLEDDKVYVIGGIVDRNRHKNLCLEHATSLGLAHAQLPIGDVIQMSSRKVLAVNHVFEILVRFRELGSWAAAVAAVMPKRKEFQLCDEGGSAGPGVGDGDADGDPDEAPNEAEDAARASDPDSDPGTDDENTAEGDHGGRKKQKQAGTDPASSSL